MIAQALENNPTLAQNFADEGYAGDKLRKGMADIDGPTIEILKRPPGVTGFVVIALRWVVERTFAWLGPHSADCCAITCRAMDAAASQKTGNVQSHPQTHGPLPQQSEDPPDI